MNICVVGYGAIGPAHAKVLSGIDKVTLYGICDIVRARADEGARQYGCKAFYSFDDCLLDDNIDVLHICTPHYLHFEMIKKAVSAGKKIVCEKPVVMKREEFDLLLRDYSDSDIFPIVQNRTNKCVEQLKEIIENDKTIGKLVGVRGILTWCRDREYYESEEWRGTKSYEGGGVLINQAIHTLDLMIYLIGGVRTVNATASNKSLNGIIEVEDTIDVRMTYENSATAILYATNSYIENLPVEMNFKFENASFTYVRGKLYRNEELICCDDERYLGKKYWGVGHDKMFHDLYECNRVLKLKDIEQTMRTVFAIYESAKNGKEVVL